MNRDAAKSFRVGLVGARGFVGSELIRLVQRHPDLSLAYVSSRERESRLLSDFEPDAPEGLHYVNYQPEQAVAADADVVVLALPNGMAKPWSDALDLAGSDALVLDLSADFRFDRAWFYGLPELNRKQYAGQRRISNPGCYATAMQLAIAPLRGRLQGPVQCFGVSGYSGAGTAASDKNNPQKLHDNIMPYSLTGHIHEREVAERMHCEVDFMPHVAPHFRGLSITCNLRLREADAADSIESCYREFYRAEPLIEVTRAVPWLSEVAATHLARLGGFGVSADGRRAVVVSVLDNLLKGAASQAMQNINLGLGLPETRGIL
jgi:N-acetyl-gamma-glutamyl-phosphate reductase